MQVHSDLARLPHFSKAVITIGSFDGVHQGHGHILSELVNRAKRSGGESVVITFDPHPRALLRPDDAEFRLITTTEEKTARLAACGVDHLVLAPFTPEFAAMSADAYVADFLVRYFQPRTIVIGYDHRFGAGRVGDIRFLQARAAEFGYEVLEIPAQVVDALTVSSSKIRKALAAADMMQANRLLGYPFQLSGRVVRGNQIGRQIGFPTANINLSNPHKLIPPSGIYAAKVALPDGRVFGAMLYIGHRPTLETSNAAQRIEVNLLGFEGDLYDLQLRVEVLDFIRPDAKEAGLEALQARIRADQARIEARLAELGFPAAQPGAPPPFSERVAIVILNYNTRKHLEAFLPSVLRYSPGARVIVADNGSPDDSLEFLRRDYPGLEILDLHQNFGFAQGYNEALRQVDADVYVLLNSDVEVTPNWLVPVLDALRADPAIGVAQPKILAQTDKQRFEYAGAAGGWVDFLGYPFCRGRIFNQIETDTGQYDRPEPCFWASGAAFFIKADLYHRLGGFDGDYFAHNEEIDLCWRLKRAGYSVWCVPQSVAYHLGGGTLEYDNPRKVFLNFRNSLFTLLKNESAGKLGWLIPARLVLDGVAGLMFLSRGQIGAVQAIVRAHFSFYKHFNRLLRKRKAGFQAVEANRRGSAAVEGVYRGSIVWDHYIRRINTFNKLID